MPGMAGVIAAIPWGMLIDKAPQLMERASTLVARAKERAEPEAPVAEPESPAVSALTERVAALEAELASAAALVSQLAEANAGLIAAGERGRRMVGVALGFAGLALMTAVVGLFV